MTSPADGTGCVDATQCIQHDDAAGPEAGGASWSESFAGTLLHEAQLADLQDVLADA